MKLSSRPPIYRMSQIRRHLVGGKPFNAASIARELEVVPETIHRDIYFMRDFLNYEFNFDHKTNSYTGHPPAITTL
jgi:hypothetical protein